MNAPPTSSAGHETSDINVRGVFYFAAGLLVVGVIIHFLIAGLFTAFKAEFPSTTPPSRIGEPHVQPPPPRLQTNPALDLQEFRSAEESKLHSYGWIDRKNGVIRIPIERAMELVAERGLPANASGEPSGTQTPLQMRQDKAVPRLNPDEH